MKILEIKNLTYSYKDSKEKVALIISWPRRAR